MPVQLGIPGMILSALMKQLPGSFLEIRGRGYLVWHEKNRWIVWHRNHNELAGFRYDGSCPRIFTTRGWLGGPEKVPVPGVPEWYFVPRFMCFHDAHVEYLPAHEMHARVAGVVHGRCQDIKGDRTLLTRLIEDESVTDVELSDGTTYHRIAVDDGQ